MKTTTTSCPGPVSRRSFLEAGSLALGGLALNDLLRLRAVAKAAGRESTDTSVILIWLQGGPSHMETYDLKPQAPADYRGECVPISTVVPGMDICEHLPLLASRSDRYCVIRTVNHPQNDHNGTHYIQTGHPLPPADRGAANVAATDKDWPAMGSVVEYLDRHSDRRPQQPFPGYVYLPKPLGHFAGYDINGQYAGWLGRAYNPLATNISKRAPDDNPYFRDCTDEELDFRISGLEPIPEVTLDRLNRRESLLEQFNARRRELDKFPTVRDFNSTHQRALTLLTSKEIGAAFDLRREPDKLRDRYGRTKSGQSLLLARRLIEAGVRFVTCFSGSNPGDGWDTHSDNFRRMKNKLMPPEDQAFSALIEDMDDRGLLDETLVVMLGEFGRTPKINKNQGRDHWGACQSVVFAGGG
ncbi:MAG: DUF1501 domain-containing protein, partial [Planctomycetes bacterium]|nr:DUF1501 domain-containing protein [Planctomycetota bacterium]